MRLLLYAGVLVAIVAGVFWIYERGRSRLARRALPTSTAPTAVESPAWLIYGSGNGAGTLRANSSQLVFTADTGRVLVLERLDIVGVTSTSELPDRQVSAPVLAVATGSDVHYFQVADPEAWIRRLR